MASTIKVNTLESASGTDITIPTGKKLVVTDAGALSAPGMVVNVVTEHTDSNTIVSSTSYVATNLSVSYTPKKAGNLIIIQANMGADTNAAGRSQRVTVFRDSTDLGPSNGNGSATQQYAAGGRMFSQGNVIAVDSSVTASARTYAIHVKAGGSYTVEGDGTGGRKTMIITEIAQ
tara:strand:- start:149 stop:673 length:525 start_codon:yes stop_codon:yes gene_type:complete